MAQRVIDKTVQLDDMDKAPKAESAKMAGQKGPKRNASGRPKKNTSKKVIQKKKRGKNYMKAKKAIDKSKGYSIDDAIKMVRETAFAKFKESVELHIKLGIDPKNADQRVRFTDTLPNGIGKSIKVLVISDDNSGLKGNVLFRDISAIDEIISNKLKPQSDFDVIVATPNAMKDLSKAARILGPKGLMPSPKNNTVTEDIKKAVAELDKGQIEIKNQPSHPVIHQIVGNLEFKDNQISENIKHLLSTLQKNTPAKLKKKFIQKAYICTSMGLSVKLEI